MRRVSQGILLTFCAVSLLACDKRPLRPLTPCTTSGASGSVPIADLKNVDLVFMVDNSNSMAEEQRKLRNEFPNMIRALVTGDICGVPCVDPISGAPTLPDGTPDGPAVTSLRVAVITSDMGVGGIGLNRLEANEPLILTCNTSGGATVNPQDADYGDDGLFRRQEKSLLADPPAVPLANAVNCDVDAPAGDDNIGLGYMGIGLPGYLTFTNAPNTAPTPAAIAEFNRRVSCLTNVGVAGCAFEQQLEALLKAITPSGYTPINGPFHSAPGDTAESVGHGDDPNTNDEDADGDGIGWFRDDSLLALVMVSDEDDTSAANPVLYNFNTTQAGYVDANGPYVAQTRAGRYPDLLHPINRYVDGYLHLRANSPGAFVFAAITGVPSDLTDGATMTATGLLRDGTQNLQEILDDSRMQYTYIASESGIPLANFQPSCSHVDTASTITATGNTTSGNGVIANVAVLTSRSDAVAKSATVPVAATAGATMIQITMPVGNLPVPGMTITGTGIDGNGSTTFTLLTSVTPLAAADTYQVTLSAPTTGALSMGANVSVGASYGPAPDMQVTGPGIPADAKVQRLPTAVSGIGPYSVTLGYQKTATASGTGVALTFAWRDVEATPARRATAVAQGIVAASSNATIQSICVDSFGPAMGRILALIQANLRGSCLPRPLIRNAVNEVSCDVFVTLPANASCADPAYNGAYDPTPTEYQPTTDPADTDMKLEVCKMAQVPVSAADRATLIAPANVHGWFYDDYTMDKDACPELVRISFTSGDTPPQGSRLNFSCVQPVQDGDLAIDINSPCTGAATTPCTFPSTDASAAFTLRYNLTGRNFDPAADFVCEFDTNTCQIACASDAECPGGFVCYNDPLDDEASQGPTASYCVNPTCGTTN